MVEKATNREELAEAVSALAARCDGAAAQDGAGYSRLDAPLGRKLAATNPATWTPRQTRAAWSMLSKYRGQLSEAGIDYAAIPEPPIPERAGGATEGHRVSAPKDGGFVVALAEYDPDIVAEIKAIPGRRFDGATKVWSLPASLEVLEPLVRLIASHDLDYSDVVVERVQEVAGEHEEKVEASKAADADLQVEGLGGELRPFQRAGVAYALRTRRTFLADQMGLGKTVQALATLEASGAFPALVVCPASLKLNWQREAERWLPGRSVEVLSGKNASGEADITIINYDVLGKHVEALGSRNFGALILDESHYTKNQKAKRTKHCRELAKDVPVRLLLSGTPLTNRPQELISQLAILERLEDLGGFWPFAKRYCAATKDRFGWDMSGASNLAELNEKLRATCYVRRNKDEVLTELPAKQRAVVPVSLDNRSEYRKAERDVVRYLGEAAANDQRRIAEAVAEYEAEHGEKPDAAARQRIVSRVRTTAEAQAERAEQLVRIEALKSTAARGKLEGASRWVEDFLESGEKLVVFGWHKEIVEALADRFEAPRISGDTSTEARQEAVDHFQEDDSCRLLICNIKAGGVGITLTAASNVAFLEQGWTPAEHEQAEDRTHRIGQEASVTCWYLLAEDTIDEEIYRLVEQKRGVVDAATEGSGETADTSVLTEITAHLQEQAAGGKG